VVEVPVVVAVAPVTVAPVTVAPVTAAPVTVEAPVVRKLRAVRKPRTVPTLRFRVQYDVETVLEAADIRQALRLAVASGAVDVLEIVREG